MEKINIAEMLKDCPSGMELDCTICDNVYLDEVTPHMIKCYIKNDVYNTIYFHHDGTYLTAQNAKCVIFPKGKTTWKDFHRPFKDGDVVATKKGLFIGIIKIENGMQKNAYVAINEVNNLSKNILYVFDRLATEDEKQKLFKAIKDNGYKWNPQTKTLEKLIVPKFKIGDRIKEKQAYISGIITDISDGSYKVEYKDGGVAYVIIEFQDDWELVPNKLEKLIKPKFKVGDRITNGKTSITISYMDNVYYYQIRDKSIHRLSVEKQDDWKLDKFDITTLKPFESRVLVRYNEDNKWCGAFFSHIDKEYHSFCYKYVTTAGKSYPYCIPYEGNEHLLNKTNDCDNYYKTWE